MKEELLKGLTEEQIAKVKACKTTEEMFALAKEEGIELTEEQLETVSGGGCFSTMKCPACGSTSYEIVDRKTESATDCSGGVIHIDIYRCKNCGVKWEV